MPRQVQLFYILLYILAKLQQGLPLPNPHKISLVNSDIEVLEVRMVLIAPFLFIVEYSSSYLAYYLLFPAQGIL